MKINSKLLLSLSIVIRPCPLVTENHEHKNIYTFYSYERDVLVFSELIHYSWELPIFRTYLK